MPGRQCARCDSSYHLSYDLAVNGNAAVQVQSELERLRFCVTRAICLYTCMATDTAAITTITIN